MVLKYTAHLKTRHLKATSSNLNPNIIFPQLNFVCVLEEGGWVDGELNQVPFFFLSMCNWVTCGIMSVHFLSSICEVNKVHSKSCFQEAGNTRTGHKPYYVVKC